MRDLAAAAVTVFALSLSAALAAQSGKSQTDNEIRFFQWKVSQDPDDFFNYDRLGVAYIQKARETGDVTYYDLATNALVKSLDLESAHPEAAAAKKHLATVYYANHRFSEALALAQEAVQLNPRDITPYGLIGDARSEMGDYAEAWAAYGHLGTAESGIQYLQQTRASAESLLKGETGAAIEHMRRAVNISVESAMPRESIAWSYFTLGEDYFMAGDCDRAQAAYAEALKVYPGYHRALAGAAKVASAQGHLAEAIDFYRKAIGVIPLPAYAASLGDVYTKAGKTAEARREYDLVEYIGRLNTFNRVVYNRELAAFYADHDIHQAEALELARKEFEVRHDIYTWDTLAWALYRNRKYDEAAAAITAALRLNTRDAMLFFHAGLIHEGLGDKAKAADFLGRALELNPQFNLLFADVARADLAKLAGEESDAQR